MAYIGSSVIQSRYTQVRPRDEFIADGFQYAFPVSQEVPGGFESNVTPVVDNVVQEPVEAYRIDDMLRFTFSNEQHFPVATIIPYQTYISQVAPASRSFSAAYDATVAAIANITTLPGLELIPSRFRQVRIDNETEKANSEIVVWPTVDHQGVVVVNITGDWVDEAGVTEYNHVYKLQFGFVHDAGILYVDTGATPTDANPQGTRLSSSEIFTPQQIQVELSEAKTNQLITQANGATGIILDRTGNYLDVIKLNDIAFSPTGGAVSFKDPYKVDYEADDISITYRGYLLGTFDIDSIELMKYRIVRFTGVPEKDQSVYMTHLGGSTYQMTPTAGSVTDLALADNLKEFTVDKFVSTLNQTDFVLSKEPASVQSILVTVNGIIKTDTIDYSLVNSGATLRLITPLAAGVQVTVIHLGFGTVSRYAGVDGSVRTSTLQDLAVTTEKVADQAITAAKIHPDALVGVIGGTAVVQENTGFQFVEGGFGINGGALDISNPASGQIAFPGSQNKSSDTHTLDDYEESLYAPILEFGGSSASVILTGGGSYTKVGDLVHVEASFVVTNQGTGSGAATISVPFAKAAGASMPTMSVYATGLDPSIQSVMARLETDAMVSLYKFANGNASPITEADVTGGVTEFAISGSYKSAT